MVVGFGFLVLVLLFRSILVPLTGVITSLLSLGAASASPSRCSSGAGSPIWWACSSTGPIMPFLPIMVFAILFGLSMDYHVFLVSRMQEEWLHTGDNRRRGAPRSGRIRARSWRLAAAIMVSVFGAFVLGNDPTIKLFGLSLATAVLFDAFIVRLIIVPVGHVPAGPGELVAARLAGSDPARPWRWSRPRTSPTRTPRSRMCPSCRPRALRTRPRRLAQARP